MSAIQQYGHLTGGGKITLDLDQAEACIALRVHDYGIEGLSDDDQKALYSLIGKIKDQIWP